MLCFYWTHPCGSGTGGLLNWNGATRPRCESAASSWKNSGKAFKAAGMHLYQSLFASWLRSRLAIFVHVSSSWKTHIGSRFEQIGIKTSMGNCTRTEAFASKFGMLPKLAEYPAGRRVLSGPRRNLELIAPLRSSPKMSSSCC